MLRSVTYQKTTILSNKSALDHSAATLLTTHFSLDSNPASHTIHIVHLNLVQDWQDLQLNLRANDKFLGVFS